MAWPKRQMSGNRLPRICSRHWLNSFSYCILFLPCPSHPFAISFLPHPSLPTSPHLLPISLPPFIITNQLASPPHFLARQLDTQEGVQIARTTRGWEDTLITTTTKARAQFRGIRKKKKKTREIMNRFNHHHHSSPWGYTILYLSYFTQISLSFVVQ